MSNVRSKAQLILAVVIILLSLTIVGTGVLAFRKTLEINQKAQESSEMTEMTTTETEKPSSVEIVDAESTTSSESQTATTENTTVPEPNENIEVEPSVSGPGGGTITGTGREGIAGTGDYNYGEALQKSLLFYELQRAGDLPDTTRCNWRGDAGLNDGSDVGLDLTGGWFDAGDNVKFNLPMSYSATMLGWSLYEDGDAYEQSGQKGYALGNIRWVNEYFIKCHPEDEVYYYQVGDGSVDHAWWGPCECVDLRMNRPSYCVTASAPGSAVTAETAASLAVCSMLFKDIDPAFSATCLKHAESLYAFADKYKSDAGYTAANGFYDSWSGFYDELCWAGVWLYRATGDQTYLDKAKEYYPKANQDYNWALCWDDVHIGAALLLAQETGESTYTSAVEQHLDFWTTGTASGDRITYTPQGLAWLDSWGSLRYATTTAFVAAVYSESEVCSASRKDVYWNFAVAQAGYALGDTGFSYLIGFGEDYPVNPHHRTAQGSYCDNMNEPGEARHILCGALVGGPDASDAYTDTVSDYCKNEVACDYNAGFTGLMAKLYTRYYGETLTGFGACETVGEEYRVDTSVNASGTDFLEIKALTYNMTAWPARAPKELVLRYYFTVPDGKTIDDLSVSSSYGQNVNGVFLEGAGDNTAYVQVVFEEYSCFPGGQDKYKKEVQFRVTGIPAEAAGTATVCLFEDGKLVYGKTPDGVQADPGSTGNGAGATPVPKDPNTTPVPKDPKPSDPNGNGNNGNNGKGNGNVSNGKVSVSVEYTMNGTGNAISANLTIENIGSETIDLNGLVIEYFFSNETAGALSFDCYHSAVNTKNGQYTEIEGVRGAFAKANAISGADTVCTMNCFGSEILAAGDKLVLQFSIHHTNWADFDLSDDYSRQRVENIVIRSGDGIIFGNEPV